MIKARKLVTQKKANEMMKVLVDAGYRKEQILAAIDQEFPPQEPEDASLSAGVANLSISEQAAEELKSVSDDRGAAEVEEKQEEDEKDFYIDAEDLLQDDEESAQQLSPTKRARATSKGSDSSTEMVVGEVEKRSTARARFSLGSATVTPGDRGRTVAGPQVEHALAYVVYESIAKKAIAGQKLSEAAGKIMKAFATFPLSREAVQEMRGKIDVAAQEAMRFRTSKRSLKSQREVNPSFLSEKDYNASHDALKIAARSEYAKIIASAVDVCLLGANKMPNVSYVTEGATESTKDKNPNTGKEKGAKNNLLLLARFLGQLNEAFESESAEENQRRIQELLDDSDLLYNLEEKWGISAGTIEGIKSKSLSADFDLEDELAESILPIVREQINRHMSELFYYPSLQTTHHYTICRVEGDWAVTEKAWCDIMHLDPEATYSSKPKYNKGALPRNNDLDEMAKTVGQAQVGFAQLVPELALFGDENYKKLMDDFLTHSVIYPSKENGNRGWDELISGGVPGTQASLEKLTNKIKENFTINYEQPLNSCVKRLAVSCSSEQAAEFGSGGGLS